MAVFGLVDVPIGLVGLMPEIGKDGVKFRGEYGGKFVLMQKPEIFP